MCQWKFLVFMYKAKTSASTAFRAVAIFPVASALRSVGVRNAGLAAPASIFSCTDFDVFMRFLRRLRVMQIEGAAGETVRSGRQQPWRFHAGWTPCAPPCKARARTLTGPAMLGAPRELRSTLRGRRQDWR